MAQSKPIILYQGLPKAIVVSGAPNMQPTTLRVISPSNVLISRPVQPTQPQPPPPPPPEESRWKEDSQTNLITEEPKGPRTWREIFYDWLFLKEFLNLYNLVWLIIATTIALGIIATCICLTVTYCRQAYADVTATTLQAGRFVSEACSSASQCLENAQCTAGECQCVQDYYYNVEIGQCLYVKGYSAPCTDSRECKSTANLGCYSSTENPNPQCLCPYGMFWGNYYGSYECLTVRAIGATCQSTSDCVASSYCAYTGSSYRCLCNSGYYDDSGLGQCVLIKQYMEPCNFYYNECASNYVCRGRVGDTTTFCQCRYDYYYNSATESCVATSTYGGACYNITQCLPFRNLLCLSSVCTCSSTQYWNGTYCVDYLLYGQACASQSECNPYDANLLCTVPPLGIAQTVCYCNTGYYFDEYNSLCVAQKIPTQNCTDSYECIQDAICQEESAYNSSFVCQCVPGYYYSTSLAACVTMATYLDPCVIAICNNFTGLYCSSTSNTCVCRNDYYWDPLTGFCTLSLVTNDVCLTTNTNMCRASRNYQCDSTVTPNVCDCPAGTALNANQYCV